MAIVIVGVIIIGYVLSCCCITVVCTMQAVCAFSQWSLVIPRLLLLFNNKLYRNRNFFLILHLRKLRGLAYSIHCTWMVTEVGPRDFYLNTTGSGNGWQNVLRYEAGHNEEWPIIPQPQINVEDATELALDRLIWRLLAASGTTHWNGQAEQWQYFCLGQ